VPATGHLSVGRQIWHFARHYLSQSGLHAWLEASCAPWCVVMVVAMPFRLPLYTGRTGHQMGWCGSARVR
jgi:hypothetical protein